MTLVCPKCGSEILKMPLVPEAQVVKVVAVIADTSEVNKTRECLRRNSAPPFDKGALKDSLSGIDSVFTEFFR
jgi:hypothetical protein